MFSRGAYYTLRRAAGCIYGTMNAELSQQTEQGKAEFALIKRLSAGQGNSAPLRGIIRIEKSLIIKHGLYRLIGAHVYAADTACAGRAIGSTGAARGTLLPVCFNTAIQ